MKKLLLVLVIMIFSCNSVFALKLLREYPDGTNVEAMDTVEFGSYYINDSNKKEPIEWIVTWSGWGEYTLLSKYVLDYKNYNDSGGKVKWETSSLKKWLNNDFLNSAFSQEEQKGMVRAGSTGDGENGTYDNKVWIPGVSELNGSFNYGDRNQPDGSDGKMRGINKNMITKWTPYAISKTLADLSYDGNYWCYWLIPTSNNYDLGGDGLNNTENDHAGFFALFDGGYDDNGFEVDYNSSEEQKNAKGKTYLGVRPVIKVKKEYVKEHSLNNKHVQNETTQTENNNVIPPVNHNYDDPIPDMPTEPSYLGKDGYYYKNNQKQVNVWINYINWYYHVDKQGKIEKSKWIQNERYVGPDGRLWVSRKTPDGKWVGWDGRVVVNVIDEYNIYIEFYPPEPDTWFKTENGFWYYFVDERTKTKKGWFDDSRDNQTYYLDPETGIMVVGWNTIDGHQYYFNESHDNEPNWYAIGNGFYESYGKKVKAYGSMFKNETTPNGKKVDANGRLISSNVVSASEITDIGVKCFDEGNYDLALKYFIEASDKGDSYASTMLGYMYALGLGVDRNDEIAKIYFEIASLLGEKNAEEALNILNGGNNITKSNVSSRISQGNNNQETSQNILGDNVHVEGDNVYQNPDGSIQIGGEPQKGAKNIQSKSSYDLSKQIKEAKLVTEYSDNITIDEIDTVTFGSYPQSDATGTMKDPIEWLVLDRQGDKALLLSKHILDAVEYYNSYSENNNWSNSNFRNWLNNNFLSTAFSAIESDSIVKNNGDKITILDNNNLDKYFDIYNKDVKGTDFDYYNYPSKKLKDAKSDSNFMGWYGFVNNVNKLKTSGTNFTDNIVRVNEIWNDTMDKVVDYDVYHYVDGEKFIFLDNGQPNWISWRSLGSTEGGYDREKLPVRPVMWVKY